MSSCYWGLNDAFCCVHRRFSTLFNGPGSPKIAPSRGGIWTPSNTWFLGFVRIGPPNGISIGSAIFARLPNVTDRQIDAVATLYWLLKFSGCDAILTNVGVGGQMWPWGQTDNCWFTIRIAEVPWHWRLKAARDVAFTSSALLRESVMHILRMGFWK